MLKYTIMFYEEFKEDNKHLETVANNIYKEKEDLE
jgi:hypothetical protein